MQNWNKFIISFAALITTTEVFAAPVKSNRYALAKKEMPEETYLVYRILERLMQTNKVNSSIGIVARSASTEKCND